MYVRPTISGLILLERNQYNYYWKSIQIYPTIDIYNDCVDYSYLNYIYSIYHKNTISY